MLRRSCFGTKVAIRADIKTLYLSIKTRGGHRFPIAVRMVMTVSPRPGSKIGTALPPGGLTDVRAQYPMVGINIHR
ncbi:MAG: hypothetical protein WBF33_33235 [Candidatus Nitrosopolaris sp.]